MKKRVLLIEDDTFLLKVFAAHLQNAGIETTTVVDGGKALAAVTRSKPNLILLDIGLPNKNGFQILEALKKKKTTKDIPVFLITKLGGEADRAYGLSLGAEKYYYKVDASFLEIVKEVAKRIMV